MAATDTVVGIVGAVLLAGIMVGVFVYEANNPVVPGPLLSNEEDKLAAFKTVYKSLNATENLDGDALANYNDTDMDGDGVNDTVQKGDLRRASHWQDSTPVPPPAPPAQYSKDFAITLYTGNDGVRAFLNWSVVTPLPQLPSVPNLSLTLLKGTETVATGASAVATGNLRTVALDGEPQLAGNYTLRVTMTQASPQTTPYTLDAVVGYGPANLPPAEKPAVK